MTSTLNLSHECRRISELELMIQYNQKTMDSLADMGQFVSAFLSLIEGYLQVVNGSDIAKEKQHNLGRLSGGKYIPFAQFRAVISNCNSTDDLIYLLDHIYLFFIGQEPGTCGAIATHYKIIRRVLGGSRIKLIR